ncbi:unnamed protein product [Ectocarpus fasciculatus]
MAAAVALKTRALPLRSGPPREGSALGWVNENEKVNDRRSSPATRPLAPAWATPLHRTPVERHAGARLGFRTAVAAAMMVTVDHLHRSHAATPPTTTEEQDMACVGPWAGRVGASAAGSVAMAAMSNEERVPRRGMRVGTGTRGPFPTLRATARCYARWTISSW